MIESIAVAVACAVAGTAMLACAEPADARAAKAKAKKAQSSQATRQTTRVALRDGGWDAFPGQPGFRDRATIYHPNGRLNGKELFDSIADRAGNAGE